jgi:sugar phosphate isomerase/epimerase
MRTDPQRAAESLSRRDFLSRLALGSATLGAVGVAPSAVNGAQGLPVPLVIFSKAYQPLKLNFDQAAEFTAECGLDGIDPPIRPDGEIVPERATEEMPAYAAALRKRGLRMPYITTAITSAASAKVEDILRTAKKLGVGRYRLGFMYRKSDSEWPQQLAAVRKDLEQLAALNKQIGIGAVVQNHSPSGSTYVGGDLDELAQLIEGFDPEQVGVAFDIAHAVNVHGARWRTRFEKIKSHLKVVYVKDTNRQKKFVPLGQGEVGETGYFKLLRQIGYRAPISLHIEYSESSTAQPSTRSDLSRAVKESLQTLKTWLG